MQAPQHIEEALKGIRSTFRVVYNPTARVVSERSFDANGAAREKEFEPRWELWDTDSEGVVYKVMTVEQNQGKGGFLPLTDRFVDFVRLVDPARYGGSVEKMVDALVDSPNNMAAELTQREFESLVDNLANYFTPAKDRGMVTVTK